jgi:hypothetical protein
MPKLIIILLLLFCNGYSAFSQKHTLGFTVNAIHNFNSYDQNSIVDEDLSLPLLVLREFGLEYTYALNDRPFKLYTGLFNTLQGIQVRRRFDAELAMRLSDVNITNASFSKYLSIRLGMQYEFKLLKITGGLNLKNIVPRSSGEIGSPVVGDMLYMGLAENEYLIPSQIHTSLFININIDLKIFRNERERLGLNIISNLGLYPFEANTSRLTNLSKGVVNEFVFNNFGNYLGVGLTYSRSSKDKFLDIFKL